MTSPGDSTYSGLKQDDFDPYQLGEKPIPPHNFRLAKRNLALHLLGWPALVISGQLFLQGLGWGFLAAVRSRGPFALPHSTAVWASNNPHLVTLITTLISTLLAGCSSFFFSYALRRSMSLYLLRPVSLAALGASVSIATRSLVFHRRHWKWSAVSLLCLIMAGIQTSAWSTLLTPVRINLSTPLVGREIDLASDYVQQLWFGKGSLYGCLAGAQDGTVHASLLDSGYVKGQSYLGVPSAISLLGQGYNASTQGILAATLNDTHLGSWSIPATIRSVGPRRSGLSSSYSMSQQGFTANISCGLQTLTNVTSPSINTSYTARPGDLSIRRIQVSSDCAQDPHTMFNNSLIFTGNGPYMWTIFCDTPNAYTLIAQAWGTSDATSSNYTGITGWSNTSYLVCNIAPITTVVSAYYSEAINVKVESVSPAPNTTSAGGAAGNVGIFTIYYLVGRQQAMQSNSVADQLQGLINTAPPDMGLHAVEAYLQGVIEMSTSLFRACLSADNKSFGAGEVPANVTKPMHGTWTTQTLGWQRYPSGTTAWVLIPGLFMAFSTVTLVLIAIYRHGGEMGIDRTIFDPSDPLHLIAAASAGGSGVGIGPRPRPGTCSRRQ